MVVDRGWASGCATTSYQGIQANRLARAIARAQAAQYIAEVEAKVQAASAAP